MTTMKAIRVHEYGSPDVLKYEDAPRPEPGEGEILIRTHAAMRQSGRLEGEGGVLQGLRPLLDTLRAGDGSLGRGRPWSGCWR